MAAFLDDQRMSHLYEKFILEYKVYIKNTDVVFFTGDESIFLELNGVTIEDDKLFLISSSFIDANFDGVADLYVFTEDNDTYVKYKQLKQAEKDLKELIEQ